MSDTKNKPSKAPLANDEVLEQDGSEDPGAGLESIRDSVGTTKTGSSANQKPPIKPVSEKGK